MNAGASFFRIPARVLGGCADCTAVSEMAEVEPGVWVLNVIHDETCPTYARILARRTGEA